MEQQNILDAILTEEIKKPKRPVVVTVICGVYFFFIIMMVPLLSRLKLKPNQQVLAFSSVITFMLLMLAFLIAMWRNLKWGVYGFIGVNFLILLGMIVQKPFRPFNAIIPLVCSVLLLFQLKNMR
jgi:hypothetical protein